MNVLGHRNFRRVWLAATASASGDAASWIALVALALGPARASVAVLAIAYTAPVAVGGLVAGWALDRFDRRFSSRWTARCVRRSSPSCRSRSSPTRSTPASCTASPRSTACSR